MVTPEEILSYWLDEIGPSGWYNGTDELDAEIRDKFLESWRSAMSGACGLWLTYPSGTLAYIILMDQFPRNMFRNDGRAFVSDRSARAAAKIAVTRNWDMKISEPARSFFYMPLVHSENLIDQDRAVRLMCTRLPEMGAGNLLHAKAHREIIRKFGRFPFRNEALDRATTPQEQAFMDGGGYGAVLQSLQAENAA